MVLLKNSGNLGSKMTNFSLPDVFGTMYHSQKSEAQVRVIMFICGHCPYVQAIEGRLIALANHFKEQPVEFVGICSNDAADYPEDRPQALKERVERLGIPFSYLIDED